MTRNITRLLLSSSAIVAAWTPAMARAAGDIQAPALAGGDGGSLAMAIAKVLGALFVVFGLMFLLIYASRKFGLGRMHGQQGTLIHVLDTRMIAPKKFITVLGLPGERIVVGVTDQQISFLASLGNADDRGEDTSAPGPVAAGMPTFTGFLQAAAGRLTGKKGSGRREDEA